MKSLFRFVFILLFLPSLAFSAHADIQKRTKKSHSYTYDLAITAVFHNEARFLKEWIEFHKIVGVQHFYLFNNLSTDNFMDVLAPYITSGEVDYFDWPLSSSNELEWNKVQCSAYEKAIELTNGKVRWLALIDVDEFIFPIQGKSLKEFMFHYEIYGGVVVNWQLYGTSSVAKIPDDQLMIEALVMKAPTQYPDNACIKSIVHPHLVQAVRDPYKVDFKKGYYAVTPDRIKSAGYKNPITIDKVRINHYWTRDEEYFYQIKLPRRNKWRESVDSVIAKMNALNQAPDNVIFKYVPELRKFMQLD